MKPSDNSLSNQERFPAFLAEIRANRSIVKRMEIGYIMFKFTGGGVSSEQLHQTEVRSFLESASGITVAVLQSARRYQSLVDQVDAMAEQVELGSEPRPVLRRRALAFEFTSASAELIAVGSELEETLSQSIDRNE